MKSLSLGIACFIFSIISNAQNVGIGTTTPKAKLHVSMGASGALPHSQAGISLESNNHVYLNLLTLTTKEGGIMFGNTNGVAQGGMYYNNPNNPEGLDFRTNGNIVRMEIDNAGNVEMKNGLAIKGNNPAANATLVSKDMNGTTFWQRASAFKVEGLLDEADVSIPNATTYKLIFKSVPVYNFGSTYAAGNSEYTIPVKGIYFFDVQIKSYESQNASNEGAFYLELKLKRNNVTTTLKKVVETSGINTFNVFAIRSNQITGDFLLEPNDVVWLECTTSLSHTIYGSKEVSSFSGRLVTQVF